MYGDLYRSHQFGWSIQGGPKNGNCGRFWLCKVKCKVLFLEVCNSRIRWHRIAFYISNCSAFYP